MEFLSMRLSGNQVQGKGPFFVTVDLVLTYCGWWLQPWNQKATASWQESHDKHRQGAEKPTKVDTGRHAADKGPCGQGYGLLTGHVWLWELGHKAKDRRIHFSSVAQSSSTLLLPHGLQQARLPCPSPTPGACLNSCPLSRWCHPATSSFVVPFSSHFQSFPASRSFPVIWFFASGGQSIGVSALASVLVMYIQDWTLGWTVWISLKSKGLSRVFSNTTVQKHQFFGTQFS